MKNVPAPYELLRVLYLLFLFARSLQMALHFLKILKPLLGLLLWTTTSQAHHLISRCPPSKSVRVPCEIIKILINHVFVAVIFSYRFFL